MQRDSSKLDDPSRRGQADARVTVAVKITVHVRTVCSFSQRIFSWWDSLLLLSLVASNLSTTVTTLCIPSQSITLFFVAFVAIAIRSTSTMNSFRASVSIAGWTLWGSLMGGGNHYCDAAMIGDRVCRSTEHYDEFPVLCHMLDRLAVDQEGLAQEIHDWAAAHGLLVGTNIPTTEYSMASVEEESIQDNNDHHRSNLPVVFAHGMGDSCFNSGMQHIGEHTSQLLGGVYVTCIPTGDTQSEDTTNGYFLNMDASVDVFAAKIAQDPQLANGFHAIGFSQGNNVIRGYIARYNNPPVDTFISVNGVNAGVGAVPHCFPTDGLHHSLAGGMCDLLMEQASRHAYSEWTQKHSFQANYWRDPRPVERDAYQKFSQLARWNNEGQFNQTYNDNFAKVKKFVWIMATEDGMVWPKEGEHWGAPDPKDPFRRILPMNETEWYQKDLFGLKTAQEAGKNYFETFEGDHLQFSMEDFDRWIHTYIAIPNRASPGTAVTNA